MSNGKRIGSTDINFRQALSELEQNRKNGKTSIKNLAVWNLPGIKDRYYSESSDTRWIRQAEAVGIKDTEDILEMGPFKRSGSRKTYNNYHEVENDVMANIRREIKGPTTGGTYKMSDRTKAILAGLGLAAAMILMGSAAHADELDIQQKVALPKLSPLEQKRQSFRESIKVDIKGGTYNIKTGEIEPFQNEGATGMTAAQREAESERE